MRYTRDFGYILYKNTLNEQEPFKTINILKRGVNQVSIKDIKARYTEPNPINNLKKKDLFDMLPLINPEFYDFYKSLTTESTLDFHPDITEEDLEA